MFKTSANLICIIFLSSCLFQVGLMAQNVELFIHNPVEVNPVRYNNTLGNPFIFETYKSAEIESVGGVKFDQVKLNYNGIEECFEVFYQNKFVVLPVKLYPKVMIIQDRSIEDLEAYPDTLFFTTKLHPLYPNNYIISHYRGNGFEFFERFHPYLHKSKAAYYAFSNEVKITQESVSKPGTHKHIEHASSFYILEGSKLSEIKLGKKGLNRHFFGKRKKIKSLIESSGINPASPKAMVELLKLLEQAEVL